MRRVRTFLMSVSEVDSPGTLKASRMGGQPHTEGLSDVMPQARAVMATASPSKRRVSLLLSRTQLTDIAHDITDT